jgi:hypothetical protein
LVGYSATLSARKGTALSSRPMNGDGTSHAGLLKGKKQITQGEPELSTPNEDQTRAWVIQAEMVRWPEPDFWDRCSEKRDTIP